MLGLRLSSAAQNDMVEIWEHIARDNRPAADRVLLRFEEVFKLLQFQPLAGFSAERYQANLRAMIQGRYVVFYLPQPSEILIVRILHSARNFERIMLGDPSAE